MARPQSDVKDCCLLGAPNQMLRSHKQPPDREKNQTHTHSYTHMLSEGQKTSIRALFISRFSAAFISSLEAVHGTICEKKQAGSWP